MVKSWPKHTGVEEMQSISLATGVGELEALAYQLGKHRVHPSMLHTADWLQQFTAVAKLHIASECLEEWYDDVARIGRRSKRRNKRIRRPGRGAQ